MTVNGNQDARRACLSLAAESTGGSGGVAMVIGPSPARCVAAQFHVPRPFWAPTRSPSRPAIWWSAAASIQSFPRPVGGKPVRDGGGERPIEICPIGPHPGLDCHVILLGGGWVKIDASDDV